MILMLLRGMQETEARMQEWLGGCPPHKHLKRRGVSLVESHVVESKLEKDKIQLTTHESLQTEARGQGTRAAASGVLESYFRFREYLLQYR